MYVQGVYRAWSNRAQSVTPNLQPLQRAGKRWKRPQVNKWEVYIHSFYRVATITTVALLPLSVVQEYPSALACEVSSGARVWGVGAGVTISFTR